MATYQSKRPYTYGTGRRKSSTARVHLIPNGTGAITVNGRTLDDYFGLETLKLIVRQPLVTTGTVDKYDVISGIQAINAKIGENGKITVLGYLDIFNRNFKATFMDENSKFQQCLADWMGYIASKEFYSEKIEKSESWSDLRRAEDDKKSQTSLALAKALEVFSDTELQNLDPQLQTNVLLGEIVVILQAIMQQNNTQAGGLSLIDTISALGLGVTTKQG